MVLRCYRLRVQLRIDFEENFSTGHVGSGKGHQRCSSSLKTNGPRSLYSRRDGERKGHREVATWHIKSMQCNNCGCDLTYGTKLQSNTK